MHKTFSIQNMQTYFSHYISCNQHKKQPITNFCTEGPCLKFMCPECIEHHSAIHSNHSIDSIKTCIKKTSEKLRQTTYQLQVEAGRNSFLKDDNTEQYTKQLIRELQEVKEGLIDEIKAYFRQKEHDIRKQTSRYVQIQKKLQSLKKDLLQATNQLKMLDKHLFVPQQTVKAVTKANKINFKGMVKHFHSRIDELQRDMTFNLKLQMNPEKRQQLRTSLNELIGIRNKNQISKTYSHKPTKTKQKQKQVLKDSRHQQSQHLKTSKNVVHSPYQMNPQMLSADRILQQNSFRIEMENYFRGEPFLHFFEVTNSALHLININNIKQGEPIKWTILPLHIDFNIPSFHRTTATEYGLIYLVGGTIVNTLKKSNLIYKFDQQNQTLLPAAELIIARSSHSILYHKELIYITGGMTDSEEVLKKCEVFNPKTAEVSFIPSCKYPTSNSCLCAIGDNQIVKLGGVLPNGQNNDTIQLFIINANMWAQIDPSIQNMSSQFGLLSCSGWAPLNKNQIFIFGGYNEEAGSQNSRMSFVLQQNVSENEFIIKYVNQKNPPLAEGFWSQQGVVHNGLIYCLQNVDGEQQNDCLQDRKNILIFNGKTWSNCLESE